MTRQFSACSLKSWGVQPFPTIVMARIHRLRFIVNVRIRFLNR